MITFGHFYLGTTFVLYDVCPETVGGRRCFVASVSAQPQIRFAAANPAAAVAQLRQYLMHHTPVRGPHAA